MTFAVIAALAMILALAGTAPAASGATVQPRIDLRVLVLSDGSSSVEAIRGKLAQEGVPHTVVDLAGSHDLAAAGFLQDQVVQGGSTIPRAKFQSVVLPRSLGSIAELTDAEKSAVLALQRDFAVRGVVAYDWANPTIGLDWSKYIGPLDGVTGQVTAAARSAGFEYLKGDLPFDDISPTVDESYGYVADPDASGTFTPYLTVVAPNGAQGSVAGVHSVNGVENLVLTFAANGEQLQFKALGHGIITWMTRGIHLGFERSYLSVHVDDVFLPDARWNMVANCTPGEDCPLGTEPTPDIRMTSGDVAAVRSWQTSVRTKYPTAKAMVLDMVFNGEGAEEAKAANGGTDPMSAALLSARSDFRWINHTWSHEYLGCIQDTSTIPWSCAKDASGNVLWQPKSVIVDQIKRNRDWATTNGLSKLSGAKYNAQALVTGEHSGLRRAPVEPSDNPWLDDALNDLKMDVIASDASREPGTRTIGRAGTVPRYPIAVYFNTGTKAEMADEYNWIYGSRAQGGSGYCEDNPSTTTCLAAPLSVETGFDSYIVPWQTRQSMGWILGNNTRPYYAHQSNLAEDRTLLTLMESILASYDRLFSASRPLVVPTMQQSLSEMTRQNAWNTNLASGRISGYVIGTQVTLQNDAAGSRSIPLTAPTGTKLATGAAFGQAYSNEVSASISVAARSSTTLSVPATAGWPLPAPAPAPQPVAVAPNQVTVSPETVLLDLVVTPQLVSGSA